MEKKLKSKMTQPLPFITADLPGIGGEIKAEPAHFVVEEIPLYEPAGEGEHVYVRLTREEWATRALQQRLMSLFDLREVDVGCAGLKDKRARVTQTFAAPARRGRSNSGLSDPGGSAS
jgi:tRNA pseudouridine13 synthase